jgi:hypothetical protein
MRHLYFRIFTFCFSLCFVIHSFGQNRDIILSLDESGSMGGLGQKNSPLDELNYTVQLLAAISNDNDVLKVVRDQRANPISINLKNKSTALSAIRNWPYAGGGGNHQYVIDKTASLLAKNNIRETRIVYLGDGFWGGVDCSAIVKQFGAVQRHYFFKFYSQQFNRTDFDNCMKAMPLFETIDCDISNRRSTYIQLQNLAKRLVDADATPLPISVSNNVVKFKSELPITKILIVNQSEVNLNDVGNIVKVTGSNLSSLSNSKALEIFNTTLFGKVSEIKYQSNTIIPSGTDIEIQFDKKVDQNKLIIIPITTLQLNARAEGNFISADSINFKYELCKQENKVKITAFLQDLKGRKVNLASLGKLSIKLQDGTRSIPMAVKVDEAEVEYTLTKDEHFLSILATYQGYFQKSSESIKITRKDCPLQLDVKITGVFKSSDEANRSYKLCTEAKDVNAEIKILDDKNIQKLYKDIKDCKITAFINGADVELKNDGTIAFDKVALSSANTIVKFRLWSGSSMLFESGGYTFTRETCGPIKDNTVLDLGKIPMMDFTRDGHCFNVYMKLYNGADSIIVSPDKYTLELTDVPKGLNVDIDTLGQFFKICFSKKAYLCDCFISPGTFSGKVIARPKDASLAPIEKVWKLTLEKEESFWIRCKGCLFAALLLSIVLWYLWGIWTKPRFKKGAKIELTYYDNPNPKIQPDRRSKKLITNFVNRYLVPYIPEKYNYENITYIATPSSSIEIDKDSVTEYMYMNSDQLKDKDEILKKNVKLMKNGELTVRTGLTYTYTNINYSTK